MTSAYFKTLPRLWLIKTSIIDNEPAQISHPEKKATDCLSAYSIFTTFVSQRKVRF